MQLYYAQDYIGIGSHKQWRIKLEKN